MQKYKSSITSTTGAAIRNVPVEVLTEAGALASLFLDRAGMAPAPNPLTTGPDGTFYFYAVNGRYSLRTTVEGVTVTDSDVVLLQDPEEITVAGPIAEAIQRAEAAAQRAEDAVEDSGIPDLVESAQNAVEDANAAKATALAAQAATDQAKQDALQAVADSNQHRADAVQAKDDAEQALLTMQQALDDAAVSAANSAVAASTAIANQAKVEAEEAQEAAELALGTMQSTINTAVQSATQTAEAAKDDAEQARDDAQASAAAWAYSMPALVKVDPATPCIIKTGPESLAIKAGTRVKIGNAYVSFPVQTAVSMPAVLTPGEDYAVFVRPDGTASAVADPFFAPAAAPVPGALKIGGFHYGLTAPGTTPASGAFATTGFTNSGGNYVWNQARVDRVAGINEFSIWDLTYRSKGEQHGFTFDPQRKVWDAIYFCSPDHITNGISRYNTPVASGTVPPKIPLEYGGDGVMTYGRLSAYEALEILASHGCRLMTQEEFASGALGVTEGQSLGGAASTIPATKREPGYTSRIGLEQATGHIWTIGGPLTSVGGGPWVAGPDRGNYYGGVGLPIFGGVRVNANNSGSRSSNWSIVFWQSDWSFGLRAACDHYQGGY